MSASSHRGSATMLLSLLIILGSAATGSAHPRGALSDGYDVYDANGNKIASVRPPAPPPRPLSQAEINHLWAITQVNSIDLDRRTAGMWQAVAEKRFADAGRMQKNLGFGPVPAKIDWDKVPAEYRRPAAMLPEALAAVGEAGKAVAVAESAAVQFALATDATFAAAAAARNAASARLKRAQAAAAANAAGPQNPPAPNDELHAAEAELSAALQAYSALQLKLFAVDPNVLTAKAKLAKAVAELALLKTHITDTQAIRLLKQRGYW